MIVLYPRQMDTALPAHRWLLKHTQLFVTRNVVSPMRSLPYGKVSTPQGEETAQRVEEGDKKRMPPCNGEDRGSDFAPARKGADLSQGVSWQEMEVNL